MAGRAVLGSTPFRMVAVRCNLRQYRQTEILGLAAGNQMLTQKRRHAKVVSRREIRAALSRNHIIFQGCHTCDSGWFTIVCVCVCVWTTRLQSRQMGRKASRGLTHRALSYLISRLIGNHHISTAVKGGPCIPDHSGQSKSTYRFGVITEPPFRFGVA